MRSIFQLLLYPICLPADILAGVVSLILWLFWGTDLRFEKRPGVDVEGKPFPGNWALSWSLKEMAWDWYEYGATTLSAHVIMYREGFTHPDEPEEWMPIQIHEHVHCEQYEQASVAGLFLGLTALLTGAPALSVVLLWALSQPVVLGAAYVVAILRGEDAYRGANHEEAAYAIDGDHDSHGH